MDIPGSSLAALRLLAAVAFLPHRSATPSLHPATVLLGPSASRSRISLVVFLLQLVHDLINLHLSNAAKGVDKDVNIDIDFRRT